MGRLIVYPKSVARWAIVKGVEGSSFLLAVGRSKTDAINGLVGRRISERSRRRAWDYWKSEHGARLCRVDNVTVFDTTPSEIPE